jgi:phosphatidylinositol-3-phosphatase
MALAVAGSASSSHTGWTPPVPSSATELPASASSHVVVIAMGTSRFGHVIGPDAPYITALAHRYAIATKFYAVSHPSLPNYLALTSGSTFGIRSDCTSCHFKATNIVDALESAGLSWKAYAEGMPSVCYKGTAGNGYAKRYEPFLYYDDIANDKARCSRVVPASQLAEDLLSDQLPTFAWISPNLCHRMDSCGVDASDRYLARLVPLLLRQLGPRGVLFLTWAEGMSKLGCCTTSAGGRVPTIVAGPDVRAAARSAIPYNHYSILRTISDALRLAPLGEAACPCTKPLNALFSRPPRLR